MVATKELRVHFHCTEADCQGRRKAEPQDLIDALILAKVLKQERDGKYGYRSGKFEGRTRLVTEWEYVEGK